MRFPFAFCIVLPGLAILAGCRQDSQEYRTYSAEKDTPQTESVSPEEQTVSGLGESSTGNTDPSLASDAQDQSAAPQTASDDSNPPSQVPEMDLSSSSTTTKSSDAAASGPLARPPRISPPERIAKLGTDDSSQESVSITSKPREIKLLVPEREFNYVDPDHAIRLSYDDLDLLKILNMDPVTPNCEQYMPDWLKALDGKRVRLRGFMYPPARETGLTGFMFARDNQICCFQRQPKVYDVFPVFLRDGVTTDYIANRPFDVVGIFRINLDVWEGQVDQLYEIEDAIVIER